MDIVLDEESDIRIPTEKPEELGHNSFPVDFFGREEWETILEIESELSPKETIGHIPTSEIFVIDTMIYELKSEIEVLLFWMERHSKNIMSFRAKSRNLAKCR